MAICAVSDAAEDGLPWPIEEVNLGNQLPVVFSRRILGNMCLFCKDDSLYVCF